MSAREYTLSGRVVDRATQTGIANLVVEAWDRDTRFHDMLGSAITNADGAFWIRLSPDYFGDYGGDLSPDVFFRVYRDEQLIKTTFDDVRENTPPGETSYLIELELAAAPQGRDRVTTEQMFKTVTFFHESDFRGVARQQKDKLKAAGSLLGAIAERSFADFDFEPIKPRGASTGDIVGQNSNTAISNLATHNVAVTEVRTFDPRANRESLDSLAALSRKLKPQDKVILYEENGIVRSYSIEKAVATPTADAAAVARIDGEVSSLKSEVTELTRMRNEVAFLKETQERERSEVAGEVAAVKSQVEEMATLQRQVVELRTSTAAKDVEIERLREEMNTMRTAHSELVQRVSPEKINQLEEQLRRLSERR